MCEVWGMVILEVVCEFVLGEGGNFVSCGRVGVL